MIHIAGSTNRTFSFPAPLKTAFEFYSDMERTLGFLTHVSLTHRYNEQQYRMLYHTTELGIYRIQLFCDIDIQMDRDAWILGIQPSKSFAPVEQEVGLYSISGQGIYSSQSIFKPVGNRTEIEYRLKLQAYLPVPYGVRFVPTPVLNSAAHRITEWRIHEIVQGFIDRSIRYYQTSIR
jgi:hypothetical protein